MTETKNEKVLRDLSYYVKYRGKEKKFIKLLRKNSHLVNYKYAGDKTLLWMAISSTNQNTNMDVIKCLIENGADVNAKAEFGFTALFRASYYGQFDVVKYLVKNDAYVNEKTYNGESVICFAAKGETSEKESIIKYLVENGADFNSKSNKHQSLLTLVTKSLSYELTKYLILEKNCPIDKYTEYSLYLLRGLLQERDKESYDKITELIKSKNGNVSRASYANLSILRDDDVNVKTI